MIMYIKHFICVDINCNSIKHTFFFEKNVICKFFLNIKLPRMTNVQWKKSYLFNTAKQAITIVAQIK